MGEGERGNMGTTQANNSGKVKTKLNAGGANVPQENKAPFLWVYIAYDGIRKTSTSRRIASMN